MCRPPRPRPRRMRKPWVPTATECACTSFDLRAGSLSIRRSARDRRSPPCRRGGTNTGYCCGRLRSCATRRGSNSPCGRNHIPARCHGRRPTGRPGPDRWPARVRCSWRSSEDVFLAIIRARPFAGKRSDIAQFPPDFPQSSRRSPAAYPANLPQSFPQIVVAWKRQFMMPDDYAVAFWSPSPHCRQRPGCVRSGAE